MPTAQKANVIEETKEMYTRSKGVVITDYRGLKVKEMQQLRKDLGAKGGEIHVIKNTLFRRAIGEHADTMTNEMKDGPSAIAFFYDNETECAKVLLEFVRTSKKLAIKGGIFDGKAMDAAQVESFSRLPSKSVLLSQIIGLIEAPIANIIGCVEAIYAEPIHTIAAVADKAQEGAA